MEQKDYLSELRKILECGICLNVVRNPKELICGHCFCKNCLDKILQFSPDGAVKIKCPNGCEKDTSISSSETTSDLQQNFMLKSASDLAVEEKFSTDDCNGRCSTCSRDAVRYCTKCSSGKFKCEECVCFHDIFSNQSDFFLPVDFRISSDNKGVMYCKEHMAEAEYLCCETEYICTYCVHRGIHKGHEHRSLIKVEETLKEVMCQRIDANADCGTHKEQRMNQVKVVEDKLSKELRSRKAERLIEYKTYLEKEEEKIWTKFKEVRQDYLTAFDSVAFLKDILSREKFEFLLQRTEIENRLRNVYLEDMGGIPGVSISLTSKAFDGAHPLGILKINHCSNDSCKSFRGEFGNVETKPSSSVRSLLSSLTEFANDNNNCDGGEEGSSIVLSEEKLDEDEERAVNDDYENKNEHGNKKVKDLGDHSGEVVTNHHALKEAGEDHRCQAGPIPSFSVENVQRIIDCFFVVKNVSKVYCQNFYSEPVVMEDFVFKICFGQNDKTETGVKTKYAKVYLYCEHRILDEGWAIECDFQVSLMSVVCHDITKSFAQSHTLTKKGDNRGWSDFVKWGEMLDACNGYTVNDSITLHAIITCKVDM